MRRHRSFGGVAAVERYTEQQQQPHFPEWARVPWGWLVVGWLWLCVCGLCAGFQFISSRFVV